jgi:hypothetical protein
MFLFTLAGQFSQIKKPQTTGGFSDLTLSAFSFLL